MARTTAIGVKDFNMMKSTSNQNQARLKKTRTSTRPTALPTNDGRHKVLHNYHDHSKDIFQSEVADEMQDGAEKRKGPRGGVSVPFPTKLHVMLSRVEEDGLSHIVSWQPHGRCFVVHKPKEFVAEVMPIYFRQSKLTSFQRQLNLYGFSRITTGRDRGGYYHELFLKHKLFLCQKMTRIRIKGTGIKGKASPETEPDFYSMTWIEPEDASNMNRDLEDEVVAAMEEEVKVHSEPTKRPSSREERRSKRNQGTRQQKSSGKNSDDGDRPCSSPTNVSVVLNTPALITPETLVKPELLVPSSVVFDATPPAYPKFDRRDRQSSSGPVELQELSGLYPPLLSSDSEDTTNDEPHTGDEIAFEGQHFHYLDSFARPAPTHSFTLEPRRNAVMAQPSSLATPLIHLVGGSSSGSLSIAQSLLEPILTPSSSSSSLFQHDDTVEINPDTIFAEKGYGGDWEVGGEDTGIDSGLAWL